MNSTSGDFKDLLSAASKKIKFNFIEPTENDIQNGKGAVAHYFGELVYENINITVGDFQIKVPFDVKYDWGTIRVYVICKIAATVAN